MKQKKKDIEIGIVDTIVFLESEEKFQTLGMTPHTMNKGLKRLQLELTRKAPF